MMVRSFYGEALPPARHLIRLLAIVSVMATIVGSVVALFLHALDLATATQMHYRWLLFLLPAAGVLVGGLYHLAGRSAEGGNDLVIDSIHEPGGGIPTRMAPLVFAGTIITHLFGGSAGREGTAVQIGGSIAAAIGRLFRLDDADTRTLLVAGVAAGFGAVFGTPLAGAVFAIEVLAIGRFRFEALLHAFAGAIVADVICTAWGIEHAGYRIATSMIDLASSTGWLLLGGIVVAGVFFGLAGMIFSEIVHAAGGLFRRLVPNPLLRPALGGIVIIALVYLLGTRDYLGLGVWSADAGAVTISSAFRDGGADPFSWWWKIVFTAVTLGSGFKGGEVTPLFYVGATLGNVLATAFGAPVDLFAALGFVAVFAGATNTPLACTLMGIELFGAGHALPLAIACLVAYLSSGRTGIYLSQRVAKPPFSWRSSPGGTTLREHRESRRSAKEVIATWRFHGRSAPPLGDRVKRKDTGDDIE